MYSPGTEGLKNMSALQNSRFLDFRGFELYTNVNAFGPKRSVASVCKMAAFQVYLKGCPKGGVAM